jgi:flavorubredoxin
LVREAISQVMPIERLRHIGFSHFEADECGSINEFLAAASAAVPLYGKIAALVSVNDVADWEAGAMEDSEIVSLGPPGNSVVRYAAHAARLGVRCLVRAHDTHSAVQ